MLPIMLIVILLMRMDGMLMALRLQQQQHQQHQQQHLLQENLEDQPLYIDDYDTNGADAIDDIVSEQLILPNDARGLRETERIRRCLTYKFGLSETIDLEEHDILKDVRTSFLPQDTTNIPRECLEMMNKRNRFQSDEREEYELGGDYGGRRLRRTPDADFNAYTPVDEAAASPAEAVAEAPNDDQYDYETRPADSQEEASFMSMTSALQSFWNEQGTKESIRTAQSRTMQKYMDRSVDPCVDFYKYACGHWEKLHPIPKDKAGFDTFEMLRENLDVVLKQLLESSELSYSEQKIVHIQNNDYETNSGRTADIVSPSAATAAVDEQASPNKAVEEQMERLRKHIVRRRDVLSDLLMRYRRQTTNTKRKRLVSFLNSGGSATVAKPQRKTPVMDARLKAKYLYQSCVNTKELKRRGIEPLRELVRSLGGWPVLDPHWDVQSFDWLNLTANLRRYNNDIFIVQWVGPDIKNSDENVIQFDQTSLGLPTREYFLQDINSKYLRAYQSFMADIMHKLGASKANAKKTAEELIIFETQLASITSPAEQRLNVTKLYKRTTLRQLHKVVPEIDWMRYLSTLQQRNVQDFEEVVIYAVDYMHDLVGLLTDTEPRTVANYLLWRFVRHRINNVDERFEDSKQNFYHTLFGREESPSRWKVCIAQVNTNMGMALGSMFVSKFFDENSKQDTLQMTHELQQSFREILQTTDWLDSETKRLAELKVNAMSLKIGYPDFILNAEELNEKYAGLDIHPDKYFENTLNVLLHTSKTEQDKLHESVNKTTWQTAPAIVNAYYSRNKNQIMFPAGILQPPFYHRHFPKSLNFGGIGVVIGHELTHGFDDKGRLFDRHGSIHKWWSDSAIKGFDERARCIIAQYSNYTVSEVGIAINGESTQGENIADNGGIRQAFHAYKNWLKENPEAAADERLPHLNMTGEQLFFLNFGQVWCGAMRPEAVRNKLNTAIHSPGRFRVIGTLSNSEDFAREFHCPPDAPMNPTHKCSVW